MQPDISHSFRNPERKLLNESPLTPKPWSEQEVERFIQLINQGIPEPHLCDLLGRRIEEISQKMKELAIAWPRPDQPGTGDVHK